MIKSKKTNRGMAIVIVLCFSAILLAYGTISVNQYKYSAPVSKKHLDRIQADFFAKGMQNIILFKVKKFPDFFLRTYRQMKWDQRDGVDHSEYPTEDPVFNNFINDDIFGGKTGVGKNEYWNETLRNKGTPLKYFMADLELLNAQDFNNETIRITVDIKFDDGKDVINKYVAIVNGDRDVANISASVGE